MAEKKLVIKGKTIGSGRPVICVPIMAATAEKITAEAESYVAQGVEMIEWRVDAFEGYKSPNAIRAVLDALKPLVKNTILIYTYRSKGQGGLGIVDKDMIDDIHAIAAEHGVADLIDVEFLAARKPYKEVRSLKKQGACVIASHHDFGETPDANVIRLLLEELYESGADIVKLALMPKSLEDVLVLMKETSIFAGTHKNTPIITMSMGTLGTLSRVAGEFTGSCVTFGSGVKASAPGQIDQEDLKKVLDVLHSAVV